MEARYGEEKSNLSLMKAFVQFPIYHARNCCKRIFYNYFLRGFSVASINLVVGFALLLFGVIFGVVEWIVGTTPDTCLVWHSDARRTAGHHRIAIAAELLELRHGQRPAQALHARLRFGCMNDDNRRVPPPRAAAGAANGRGHPRGSGSAMLRWPVPPRRGVIGPRRLGAMCRGNTPSGR